MSKEALDQLVNQLEQQTNEPDGYKRILLKRK
jgi:hypothetical protein